MNPVLQRLALRAIPGISGVRPRIANRFDWSTPAPLTLPVDTGFVDTAPSEQAAVPVSHARTTGIPRSRGAPPSHIDGTQQRPSPAAGATDQAIDSARAPDFDAPSAATTVRGAVAAEPPVNPMRPSKLPQPPDEVAPPPYSTTSTLLLPDLAAPTEPAFTLSISEGPEAHRSLPEQRGEPALPDIHVTIGRIDITAEREQRAAPRPAPPPRPKLMSLEDYLAKGRSRR